LVKQEVCNFLYHAACTYLRLFVLPWAGRCRTEPLPSAPAPLLRHRRLHVRPILLLLLLPHCLPLLLLHLLLPLLPLLLLLLLLVLPRQGSTRQGAKKPGEMLPALPRRRHQPTGPSLRAHLRRCPLAVHRKSEGPRPHRRPRREQRLLEAPRPANELCQRVAVRMGPNVLRLRRLRVLRHHPLHPRHRRVLG